MNLQSGGMVEARIPLYVDCSDSKQFNFVLFRRSVCVSPIVAKLQTIFVQILFKLVEMVIFAYTKPTPVL